MLYFLDVLISYIQIYILIPFSEIIMSFNTDGPTIAFVIKYYLVRQIRANYSINKHNIGT